jgi:hypothetical protein
MMMMSFARDVESNAGWFESQTGYRRCKLQITDKRAQNESRYQRQNDKNKGKSSRFDSISTSRRRANGSCGHVELANICAVGVATKNDVRKSINSNTTPRNNEHETRTAMR